MATLKQIYDLSADVPLLERVVAAIRGKANLVLSEDPPVDSRVSLAKAVLRNAEFYARDFKIQIADGSATQKKDYPDMTLISLGIGDDNIVKIVDVAWDLVASLYF